MEDVITRLLENGKTLQVFPIMNGKARLGISASISSFVYEDVW